MIVQYRMRAIKLLRQHHARETVGQRQRGQRPHEFRRLLHALGEAVRPADDERDVTSALPPARHAPRQLRRAERRPALIEHDFHASLRHRREDALGCAVEKVQEELGLYQLRAGRSLIDLVDVAGKLGREGGAPPGREGRNLDHLCLRVDPFDAAAIAAHLRAHGVTPGAVVRRYGAEGDGPSLYIEDPEGNVVELKGPPDQS